MLAKFAKKRLKKGENYIIVYKIVDVLCEYFVVSAILIDEDGKQFLQLVNPQKNTKIIILGDLDKSLNVRDLTKVAGIIDPVVKREITRYIRISAFSCTEEREVYSHTGWENGVFRHPNLQKDAYWLQRTEQEIPVMLAQRGSIEIQKQLLEQMLERKAGVVALGAFAAPLVHIIGAQNFVIFLASRTKTGKTTAIRAAASFFFNPVYISSMNTTVNAMEILADTFRDLPLVLDELETISKGQNSMSDILQLIYTYTQGVGRQRATTTIRMRETATMRGIMLTSGEKNLEFIASSIKGRNMPAGAWNRVLQIEDTDLWGETEEEKRKLCFWVNQVVRKNHGVLGVQYLSFLQNIDKTKIIEVFENFYRKLQKNGAEEYSGHIAVLLTALYLIRDMLHMPELGKYTEQFLFKLGKKLVEKKQEETNICELFLEKFEGWLLENGRKVFWGDQTETENIEKDELFASVKHVNRQTEIAITAKAFGDFCTEVMKYPTRQVLTELKKKNMLKTNKQGQVIKTIWLKSATRKGYIITLPAPEPMDDDDDPSDVF